jgi:hypothetical protein
MGTVEWYSIRPGDIGINAFTPTPHGYIIFRVENYSLYLSKLTTAHADNDPLDGRTYMLEDISMVDDTDICKIMKEFCDNHAEYVRFYTSNLPVHRGSVNSQCLSRESVLPVPGINYNRYDLHSITVGNHEFFYRERPQY